MVQKKQTKIDDKRIEILLCPKTKKDMEIETALSSLQPNYNILFLSDQTSYFASTAFLMKKFSKKKGSLIIYVAVNKPVEKIKKDFSNEEIEMKNVVFIDAVTEQVGAKKISSKNVTYISSVSSLNELMNEIEKKLKEKSRGEKLLLFDSISTLLVYNDPLPVEKMIHSLMGKLDRFMVNGVFLMARSKEHEDLIQTISQFCDKVIEI